MSATATTPDSRFSARPSNSWCNLGIAALLALSLAACGGNGGGGGGSGSSGASSWSHQAYVKASNPGIVDNFAGSVALSDDGNTLVVSADGEDSNQITITPGANPDDTRTDSGAAYVFVRSGSTWSLQAYLKAPNAGAGDQFGFSVGLNSDGSAVVVGALNEDDVASNAGAAYVFTRSGTNWSHQATLKAPNAGSSDRFGWSVAISDDTVVVGAPYENSNQASVTNGLPLTDNDLALDAGAAYVFVRSGTAWNYQSYLKASNPGQEDRFGYSVAVDGDTVVVGAIEEDNAQTAVTNGLPVTENTTATDAGAAYVFVRSGGNWTQQAYLKGSTAGANSGFGGSVDIDGNTVVVGAGGASNEEGAGYVYTRSGSTWSEQGVLMASQADPGDYFGFSVAISGDTVVVGASGETGANNSASFEGAAYVYTRSGTTWTQRAYLKAPNAEEYDLFAPVAIGGSTIVVGAPYESSGQTTITSTAAADNDVVEAGAAYVFVGN